jgi:hypothetical protein
VKGSLIQHFSAINGKVYKPDRRFNVCRGSRIQNKKGVYPTKTGDMKFYDWLDDFISVLPGIFRRLWPLQAVSLISLALVGCEGGSNHHKILIVWGTTYTDHAWDTWTIVNIKYIWILHTYIYDYVCICLYNYIIIYIYISVYTSDICDIMWLHTLHLSLVYYRENSSNRSSRQRWIVQDELVTWEPEWDNFLEYDREWVPTSRAMQFGN